MWPSNEISEMGGTFFEYVCSEMEVLVCGTTKVCWLQSIALEKVCRNLAFEANWGYVVVYVFMQEHCTYIEF